MVRQLQPGIIVNDRLDLLEQPGGWDFRSPEQFKPREWVKMNGIPVPWETCQTFSGSWGYYRDELTWKDNKQLLALLIDTVSKGGNLLLNVGPTGRGTFDDRAVQRLDAIGEWMQYHSRSIYGCTRAPLQFKAPENTILTYNPASHRLYIHLLAWPMETIFLEGYAGKVKYAQFLHDGSEIILKPKRKTTWMDETAVENELVAEIPITKPPVEVPVIELFLKD
jgi:alpha-L-fucosidase